MTSDEEELERLCAVFHNATQGVTILRNTDPYQRTRVGLRAVLADIDADVQHEPCESEIYSWDYYRPSQVDSYWIRCTEVGPHTDHKDSNTGAKWLD